MKNNASTNRTTAQACADQIDCDLDNMARRLLNQAVRDPSARALWEKAAKQIDGVRSLVRQRMHEDDRKVTA